jgi:CheY-like chemotaxis protein
MNKRILLLEDDDFHRDLIEDRIRRRWRDTSFEYKSIANEKAFFQTFDQIVAAGFDLVIIDQMIPYTSADDESDDPQALALDAFRGGARCYERLREDERTKAIPVVFYTILDRERVPEQAVYVKKTGDAEMTELLGTVGSVLRLP